MKKLIVFCDGTWNSADQESPDNKPCPTNVSRLFEATTATDRQGNPQLVHYIQGVGTRFAERLTGGGFGFGISDNIKEGYQFICSNYEEGDEIFLFGFSRGAFTARSIAGFIHNLGILKRNNFYKLNEAFNYYRDKSPEWKPESPNAVKYQADNCWPTKAIHFVGVWDTVGALGAPYGIVLSWIIDKLFKCGFHDTKLSSSIKSAYHALAIDEHRWPFRPTRWELSQQHQQPEDFQEKWFPGVHSDIGGGYPESGLADVALAWMAENAEKQGMQVDLAKIAPFPPFAPNPNAAQHDSQKLFYRLATLIFVKLPSFVGIAVPGASKALIRYIDLKGDFHRPNP
jgi:uncharacterized protein (DUF2235 family)